MADGKNKLERGFRILFDDSSTNPQDLTEDLIEGTVSGGGLTYDEVDFTGVSDAVRNFLAGHAESEITAQFHVSDKASTGSHTVLNGQTGKTGTLTLRWGDAGSVPETGDIEWEGEYVLLEIPYSMSGGKAIVTARWKPTGSVAPVFGTVT